MVMRKIWIFFVLLTIAGCHKHDQQEKEAIPKCVSDYNAKPIQMPSEGAWVDESGHTNHVVFSFKTDGTGWSTNEVLEVPYTNKPSEFYRRDSTGVFHRVP